MENVGEVMADVGNWEEVGGTFGLGVPPSKLQEISRLSTTKERSLAVGKYWVETYPHASWENLARVLYQRGEKKALEVIKQYLHEGMYSEFFLNVSLLATSVQVFATPK